MTVFKNSPKKNKVLLCILDGWGIASSDSDIDSDATTEAIFLNNLLVSSPHLLLKASGEAVGLPEGQFGNSEVGHSTIGFGRVIKQSLQRIDESLEDGYLSRSPILEDVIMYVKNKKSTCHVCGLLSDGGVHSHINQIKEIVNYIADQEINVYFHAVLDGRDTPQRSALKYLNDFSVNTRENVKIVSVCGRFHAMDRDKRWERTEDAYHLIAEQYGYLHASAYEAIFEDNYYNEVSDEFIEPTVIGKRYKKSKDDCFIMLNFRADRARQLVQALGDPDFSFFKRKSFPRFAKILSLVEYDKLFSNFCTPVFSPDNVQITLGAVVSKANKKQIRIAETEKYAHVTFFLNGGVEEPFENEERILIPSSKVKTYDEFPRMGAAEITTEVLRFLKNGDNDLIVVNFANPDMLGHTGNLEATKEGVRFVDDCLKQIVGVAEKEGYITVITADHGNAENMKDSAGNPHTAHTSNKVPFLVLNLPSDLQLDLSSTNRNTLGLSDIAPTILQLLGLDIPSEMQGFSLVKKIEE